MFKNLGHEKYVKIAFLSVTPIVLLAVYPL